jgi:ferritin-like metal-binding protein YciE
METTIKRYLEDAIAAEKSFETQLKGFAEEATLSEARSMFEQHAAETRVQYETLTSRLNELGGSTSTVKSFLAHMFNMAPKAAQIGHVAEERTTQDLIMAFSVENAEVAMYEALFVAADLAGDRPTADLARRIQAQEQQTADKVWSVIAHSAAQGFAAAQQHQGTGSKDVLIRYLQDAEAAERNFEDALASFSKMGDQPAVKSLLSTMSRKALTQHERLEARLRTLGSSPSTAKSILAHVLAFTPVSAQMGHEESEKSTQHLMITYSAAAAEMGMYEALAASAAAAGDRATESLARQLQSEEKEDHRLAWQQLLASARESYQSLPSHA